MQRMRVSSAVLAGVLAASGLVGVLCGVALLEEFRFPSGDTTAGDPVQRPRLQLLLLLVAGGWWLVAGGSVGWVLSVVLVAALACTSFRRAAARAAAVAVPLGAVVAAVAGVGLAASVGFRDTDAVRAVVTAVAALVYAVVATVFITLWTPRT